MKDELDAIVQDYEASCDGYAFDLSLDLSSIIARCLKSAGWSQKDLCNATGMREAYLSRVMRNKQNWTRDIAARLLHALGAKPKLMTIDSNLVVGRNSDSGVLASISREEINVEKNDEADGGDYVIRDYAAAEA